MPPAVGAGVPVDDATAAAVVDIGGNTTNVAVIVNGSIISSRAERVGSSDIDAAIMDFVRRHRGLTIGVPTAERLKLELSSATEPEDPQRKINVRGRDVQTGAPGAVDVAAAEVYQVTQPIVRKIAEEVRATLTDLAPEVSGDIYDRGVILTGGGALLEGLGPNTCRRNWAWLFAWLMSHAWRSCAVFPKCSTSRCCLDAWREPSRIHCWTPSPRCLRASCGDIERKMRTVTELLGTSRQT